MWISHVVYMKHQGSGEHLRFGKLNSVFNLGGSVVVLVCTPDIGLVCAHRVNDLLHGRTDTSVGSARASSRADGIIDW